MKIANEVSKINIHTFTSDGQNIQEVKRKNDTGAAKGQFSAHQSEGAYGLLYTGV